MDRREFLATTGGALAAQGLPRQLLASGTAPSTIPAACCGPKYGTPTEAMASEPEKLLYVTALPGAKDSNRPDYMATVDVDRKSSTYGQVIDRLSMPNVGDELHHFGWNACSSCHGDADRTRRYLVIPGLRSSRIHIADAGRSARAQTAQGHRTQRDRRKDESLPRRIRFIACPTARS